MERTTPLRAANHRFILDWIESMAPPASRAALLDFGCGNGEIVFAARANGYEAVGAETFYEGARFDEVVSDGATAVIHRIVDGRLPFEDGTFDLVVSNQVFEHVEDLGGILDELHRVMRPGGTLLATFPTKEVLREGHMGLPLVHRLRVGSRRRYCATFLLRALGMGSFKEQRNGIREWVDHKLDWLDRYVFYRTLPEVKAAFASRFTVTLAEDRLVEFRLREKRWGRTGLVLLRLPLMRSMARLAFRYLGGTVVIATRIPAAQRH